MGRVQVTYRCNHHLRSDRTPQCTYCISAPIRLSCSGIPQRRYKSRQIRKHRAGTHILFVSCISIHASSQLCQLTRRILFSTYASAGPAQAIITDRTVPLTGLLSATRPPSVLSRALRRILRPAQTARLTLAFGPIEALCTLFALRPCPSCLAHALRLSERGVSGVSR